MQQSDTDSVLLVSENWSVLEKSGHTRSFEHSSEIMSEALRDLFPFLLQLPLAPFSLSNA